jgi:hypothetical protein
MKRFACNLHIQVEANLPNELSFRVRGLDQPNDSKLYALLPIGVYFSSLFKLTPQNNAAELTTQPH